MDQQMPNQTTMEQGDTNQPAVSKWLWITLILVIVLAAIYFIWYYTMGSGKKTESTTNTETTTEVDETVDWQTYTSAAYGYTVKYPKTWTAKDTDPKLVDFRETGKTYSVEATDIYAIAISVDDNAQTKTALQLANARKAASSVGTPVVTETTIDSIAAAQIDDYLQKATIIINNNKRYDIVTPNFGTEVDNVDIRKIYDKMLSTFKFTTATSATADWKTYTNSTYGFSYKYPKDWTAKDGTSQGQTDCKVTCSLVSFTGSNKFSGSVIDFDNFKSSITPGSFTDQTLLGYVKYSRGKTGVTEKTINGVAAVKLSMVNLDDSTGTDAGYFFLKGNKIYSIEALFPQSDAISATNLDNMASTFQFTN